MTKQLLYYIDIHFKYCIGVFHTRSSEFGVSGGVRRCLLQRNLNGVGSAAVFIEISLCPPPPPPHSTAIHQPLAEIRGNIAFGKCVRANKGEDMLLKKKSFYIYTLYTLIVITSGGK